MGGIKRGVSSNEHPKIAHDFERIKEKKKRMSTKWNHVGSCWIEYGMKSMYSDRWLRFRRAHSS